MNTALHLSISEVLSLLKEDFPDLTITKIRYLESQGLIDPERTASGYRKFYSFDIDRLRWILRQQRDNFLPLKVIKKRLDDSDGRTPTEDIEDPSPPELDLARDPGKADPPPVWMLDHAAAKQDQTQPKSLPVSNPAPATPPVAPDTKAQVEVPMSDEPTPTDHVKPAAALQPSPPPQKKIEQAPPKVSPPLDAGPTDVSLTRAELLKSTGLTDRQLHELETFGIVPSSQDDIYGSAALICAKHAATLLDLGIEARHLRAYKVAADRQAGLYEQMLMPLLRQRNPAARAQAMQRLDQVVRAGNAIQGALLKQSLKGIARSGG